jgi:hypothetical protein
MADAFLLARVLLRFDQAPDKNLRQELSSAAMAPDGSLWLGSDERTSFERLIPVEPFVYSAHETYAVGDFLELFTKDEEIDIEGMDFSEGYLWLMGSHSTKRKKPRGDNQKEDLEKLSTIETELNRYMMGRIPLVDGVPVKKHKKGSDRRAAYLEKTNEGNILVELLKGDEHLAPFLNLPAKDNGVDMEGLAVRGDRLFIGFRGPVLRGWALILEARVEESEPGRLRFAGIDESGVRYYKHFLDLNGLGIRELCFRGDDLLILAGPTMKLESRRSLFCLRKALNLKGNTITSQDGKDLSFLFDLPSVPNADHPEGMVLCSCFGRENQLMIIYDKPGDWRLPDKTSVYADVFQLESD